MIPPKQLVEFLQGADGFALGVGNYTDGAKAAMLAAPGKPYIPELAQDGKGLKMKQKTNPTLTLDCRLFLIQVGIVLLSLVLVLLGFLVESRVGEQKSFGFFWFAFLSGCIGGSVGVSRRAAKSEELMQKLEFSWITTAMPVFFGGMMASVTYLLFLSGIFSGDGGTGLLRTNLFPNFVSTLAEGEPPTITAYLQTRPSSIQDVGKLLVWCFIGGYSESFVLGVLTRLEKSTQAADG